MERQMPNITGMTSTETVDSITEVKWQDNHKNLLEDRNQTHFWSVQVPKMVNSGVYSIETMLENGWVYIDDKNQMQIHTKPPGKR
jgi:hypothetical protein